MPCVGVSLSSGDRSVKVRNAPKAQIASMTINTTRTLSRFIGKWSRRWDSNPQPTVYKTVALPIELCRQNLKFNYFTRFSGLSSSCLKSPDFRSIPCKSGAMISKERDANLGPERRLSTACARKAHTLHSFSPDRAIPRMMCLWKRRNTTITGRVQMTLAARVRPYSA